jgi:general L-amino acid transport system substrate-binding protein
LRGVALSLPLICAVFGGSSVYGGTIEHVKAEGVVQCGSAERPGLAEPDRSGRSGAWRGLNVEICHAIAVAVLGSAGRIEFHRTETQQDFDAVSQVPDAVFFLTASELIAQNLAGTLIPGPVVFYETHALIVKENSAARRLEDLAGARVCFVTGSGAQRSLESFFEAKQLPFFRLAFSEADEMDDAYIAGRCDAVADELTALARLRLQEGAKADRILPQPLAVFPIMAYTSIADGKWAGAVAWTIHTLIRADVREGSWRADGVKALPIDGADLGLDQKWQARLIGMFGAYGDIYRRTIGDQSVYGLTRGLNAPVQEGGLFLAPYVE